MTQRQLYSGLDLYDWRGTGPNGRTKAVDVDKWQQNQEDIRHLPGAFPVQNVVITDGQITPTAAALTVDTEGGAPADDLTAIAPGDLHAGMLLALCSMDTGRKVTIKNSAGASGIQTLDGKDVVLDTQYAVMLRLVSTESLTLWREEPGPLRLQLTVSTPDTLGGVKVQTGDDDGLEMIGDKLRVRQANATQRGSVLASVTAAANAVPQAGEDGTLDESWVPVTLFNTRIVITESNPAWQPPVTGWARVTVIGGGGSGGNGGNGGYGGNGGKAGGQSSFGTISATGGGGGGGGGSNAAIQCGGGGGGGAGHVVTAYVYLASPVKIVIGAGAIQSTGQTDSATGGDGAGEGHGFGGHADTGGTGAAGAGNGTNCGRSSFSGAGGSGGVNGTGFGGGGGGAGGYRTPVESNAPGGAAYDGGHAGADTRTSDTPVGGNGGAGAVIIEYYDPAKEGA
ncbi:hypothetical protein AB9L11_00810 [Desulfovibrio piger]